MMPERLEAVKVRRASGLKIKVSAVRLCPSAPQIQNSSH